MERFQTLALNFVGWSFGITVTWHFRPKLGRSNEMIYFESISKKYKKCSWKYNDYISVKILVMLEIKFSFYTLYIIYRPELPNQNKLLKELLKTLKWNISKSKIWYDIQAWPGQLTSQRKHLKSDQELKFTCKNMSLLNNHKMRCMICIPDLLSLKTRQKAKNLYNCWN